MIKSRSFNQVPSPQKLLAKDVAAHPTADRLLTWLQGVNAGSVLLLTSKNGGADGPYVTGIPAKENDWVILRPSRAMKDFRQLLKGLLPVRSDASEDLWQAALPLEALLNSDEVRRRGVRHTEALLGALRALSQAQQKWRDRQDVALDTARAGSASDRGSLDDEAASSEWEPGSVDLTVLDMQRVWAMAAEQSMHRSSVQSSSPPVSVSTANGPNRALVRRAQSFNLRGFDLRLSFRKKDDASD